MLANDHPHLGLPSDNEFHAINLFPAGFVSCLFPEVLALFA
jgi:hypothetical protein